MSKSSTLKLLSLSLFATLAFGASNCSSNTDTNTADGATTDGSTDTKTLTSWLGSTPHFRAIGFINGEEINIDISGDAAKDTSQVYCEREYQVPTDATGAPDYSKGHNSEVRVYLPLTVNNQSRILQFALKRHNVQADPPGTVINVVPRDDANPPCGSASCPAQHPVWLSWRWTLAADKTVLYKQAAISGSVTLGEYTGSKDSTGLFIAENTGTVGGYATGTWSETEQLKVSFDVKCTTNAIDNSY